MPSEFDDAFAKAHAHHESSVRDAHIQEMERQRDQRVARRISETVLRQVGADACRKLHDLKVPLTTRHLRRQLFRRDITLHYWSFDKPILHLSDDGYFLLDTYVVGSEGFASLVEHVRFDRWTDGSAGIFVDRHTQQVMIRYRGPHGDEEWTQPFVDWAVQRVIAAHANAQRR